MQHHPRLPSLSLSQAASAVAAAFLWIPLLGCVAAELTEPSGPERIEGTEASPMPVVRALALHTSPVETVRWGPGASIEPLDRDAPVTQGSMQVEVDGERFALPLVRTAVDASISGLVAEVEVTQVFGNPFPEPIEAQYLFPLPDEAAVDDMILVVGDRRVLGEIHRREEARRIYEEAREQGKTAALLDQERPNLFTQRVANILPGESVTVTLHFVDPLSYEKSGYEWVFPLTVGPRFIPETGTGAGQPMGDAQTIRPPYVQRRAGSEVDLQVWINSGVPLRDLRSPSHRIDVQREGRAQASVTLKPSDRIPNKDFILRYEVAGEAPDAALLTHRSGLGGYFLLLIQPPDEELLTEDAVVPKEMVFVVDTSCSMRGFPMDKAKETMELAIREMNRDDRFLVLDFNDEVSSLAPFPLPNTPSNRTRGLQYVQQFRGSGGTRMLSGIEAALDLPADPLLLRTVLFLTDGYIGNETEILASIEQRLGRTRLFSLGVGSSVNRFLLDRMAKVGRGSVEYVRQDEDASRSIQRFYDRIRNPVLTDIEVDFEGINAVDLLPDPVPDLFAGQPIVLLGRYQEPGRGSVTVRGRIRGRSWEKTLRVDLPKRQDEHAALASLWARQQIEELEGRQRGAPQPTIKEEIVQLALRHRLMTQYTSFVAVEERVVVESGQTRTVRVPVEGPEGVDLVAAGADLLLQGTTTSYGGLGYGGGGRSMRAAVGRGVAAPQRSMGSNKPQTERKGLLALNSPSNQPPATSLALETTDEDQSPLEEVARALPSLRPSDGPTATPAGQPVRLRILREGRGLPAAKLFAQLEPKLEFLRTGFTAWQRQRPDVHGGWRLRLHVDAQGQVRRVEVLSDSLKDASLLAAFDRHAKSWRLTVSEPGSFDVALDFGS